MRKNYKKAFNILVSRLGLSLFTQVVESDVARKLEAAPNATVTEEEYEVLKPCYMASKETKEMRKVRKMLEREECSGSM